MKSKKDQRFSVSLDSTTLEQVDLLAEKLKRSRAYALRFIIEDFFERPESRKWLVTDPEARKR